MLTTMLLSFGIALASLCLLLLQPFRRVALDRPNERSLHETPVPRTGGIAIAAGVAGSLALTGNQPHPLLLVALALVAVSFCDDLFGLPTLVRFALHLAAAAIAVFLVAPGLGPAGFAAMVLAIAWITNLYNFMDGTDGLAGGMAIVGFGACAFALSADGPAWLLAVCVAIPASALAFLLFNFPPARIFMGDSGSIALGFMAGAVGAAGWQAGAWEPWFPVLVFSPFIVDATATLGARLLRRENVLRAHRNHYYQRLVRMGFGRRNTVLAEYLLMALAAGMALLARDQTAAFQAASLAAFGAGYAALAVWIDDRWARHADGATS